MITANELKDAIKSLGLAYEDKNIDSMFDNIDYKGNNKLNYSEFIAATLSVQQVMTQIKLTQLFKHFDVDDTDYITPENLKEAFAKAGK
mgnify:CR=1 FL=1